MAPPAGLGDVAVAAASVGLAPDLKKRVEIMAGHVARSGPSFESTVKAKNAGNPQFAFLSGGDGAEYYQALLQAHAATSKGPPVGQAGAAASPSELIDLLWRWPEPPAPAPSRELEGAVSGIVASLEHMASRDAIRSGREWIEANVGCADAVAHALLRSIRQLATCAHRLHILFLLHDVLQTECSKQGVYRPIVAAFRPFLPWMLRPAIQLAESAVPSNDESQKVLKLLSMWQERGILGATEATEIKLLATVRELPAAPPRPPQAGGLGRQLVGVAPGLLQQVQAQVQAQQAQQQLQPPQPPVAPGLLVPPAPRPAALGRPLVPQAAPPNFSGVLRPGLLPPAAPGPCAACAACAGAAAAGAGAGACAALACAGAGAAVGAGCSPGLAVVPALPLPGRPAQTPETVPVGVMAAMLRHVSRRGKDLHTAFVPYKPLDPLYTPQVPPVMAPTTARLMERLSEYYDVVGSCVRDAAPPPGAAPAGGAGAGAAVPPPAALAAAPAAAAEAAPSPAPAAAAAPPADGELDAPGTGEGRSRSRSPAGLRPCAGAAAAAGRPGAPAPAGRPQAVD